MHHYWGEWYLDRSRGDIHFNVYPLVCDREVDFWLASLLYTGLFLNLALFLVYCPWGYAQ